MYNIVCMIVYIILSVFMTTWENESNTLLDLNKLITDPLWIEDVYECSFKSTLKSWLFTIMHGSLMKATKTTFKNFDLILFIAINKSRNVSKDGMYFIYIRSPQKENKSAKQSWKLLNAVETPLQLVENNDLLLFSEIK